ncbi:MAG: maleylpyruvate isomerase N-terminal domain-containing protein [Chloroflexota bacterium]|nr:maleylpyruvate isomerase N-terminal domain-containing protein [Chloroflexota bacterium]
MTDVAALLQRLGDVEARLVEHAAAPLPSGLTDPEPGASERWEAGQVWAHIAEFVPYWLAQIQQVISPPNDEPVPFGRTKADPGRIAAIERDRRTAPEELLRRVRAGIAELRATLAALPPDAWSARGLHPTAGEITLPKMIEWFEVGHLEEHADQLDGLGH